MCSKMEEDTSSYKIWTKINKNSFLQTHFHPWNFGTPWWGNIPARSRSVSTIYVTKQKKWVTGSVKPDFHFPQTTYEVKKPSWEHFKGKSDLVCSPHRKAPLIRSTVRNLDVLRDNFKMKLGRRSRCLRWSQFARLLLQIAPTSWITPINDSDYIRCCNCVESGQVCKDSRWCFVVYFLEYVKEVVAASLLEILSRSEIPYAMCDDRSCRTKVRDLRLNGVTYTWCLCTYRTVYALSVLGPNC